MSEYTTDLNVGPHVSLTRTPLLANGTLALALGACASGAKIRGNRTAHGRTRCEGRVVRLEGRFQAKGEG